MPGEREVGAEIGPLYDTAGVARLLGGQSEQTVHDRRDAHTLLAAQTSDGRWVYPAFQFSDRDVDPALASAIQALRGVPAWSAALWFVTPNPDLDEMTPLAWAQDGQPADTLTASARTAAHEWR